MKCITRNELTFNNITIPARTECRIIESYRLDNYINDANHNATIIVRLPIPQGVIDGVCIKLPLNEIYICADNFEFRNYKVNMWKVEKLFKDNIIPNELYNKNQNGKILLLDIIFYLEDEFNKWVVTNCAIKRCSFEDTDWEYIEPEDKCKYITKKMKYTNKLEILGFTYDFNLRRKEDYYEFIL